MNRFLVMLLCAAMLCSTVFSTAAAQSFTGVEVSVPATGYGVTIYWYSDDPPEEGLKENIQKIFFDVYPVMRETYGTSDVKHMSIYLWDESVMSDGVVAYASSDAINCSRQFLEANKGNLNCIVHEMFHVVQNGYPDREENDLISVLCEGLADVARYDYSVYDDPAWSLPAYTEGQSYMDSYTVTAAFLVWIRDTYDDMLCIRLNRLLHEGAYGDHIWMDITGCSLDTLWTRYVLSHYIP